MQTAFSFEHLSPAEFEQFVYEMLHALGRRPEVTRAPHVLRKSTAVTARCSNSTGLPLLPSDQPLAMARASPKA
jgi:hypothetical protein